LRDIGYYLGLVKSVGMGLLKSSCFTDCDRCLYRQAPLWGRSTSASFCTTCCFNIKKVFESFYEKVLIVKIMVGSDEELVVFSDSTCVMEEELKDWMHRLNGLFLSGLRDLSTVTL
jgi:hypothetical protein